MPVGGRRALPWGERRQGWSIGSWRWGLKGSGVAGGDLSSVVYHSVARRRSYTTLPWAQSGACGARARRRFFVGYGPYIAAARGIFSRATAWE
jgi:hypothetical protein